MIRVLIAIVFVALRSSASAAEIPDAAKQWWQSLDETSRYEIQGNLILTGHYQALVDAEYGALTYNALRAYEVSQGLPANGILSSSELSELRRRADKVYADLGMTVVSDTSAGVSTYAPLAILTHEVRELEGGLTLSSSDGQFVFMLQGWDHDGTSLKGARDYVLRAMPDAEITYQTARADRAVVSGRTGSDSFYAMVHTDEDKVVGFSVVWTENYASSALLTAMFAASYSGRSDWFEQGASTSGEQVTAEQSPAGGERIGAFFLPDDDESIIILAGDINQGTALDFIRAQRKHPEATALILSSDGGSVEEGLLVAQQVFDKGLSTYVPKGAGCYSACAYIFFAGKSRIVDGELGVHQVSGDGVTAADAQLVISDVLEALNDFGVPDEVVSSMLRTRPDDMYILSDRELAAVEIEPDVLAQPKIEEEVAKIDSNDGAASEAIEQSDPAIRPHIRETTLETRKAFPDVLYSVGVSQGNASNVGHAFYPDSLPPVLPEGTFVKIRFGARQSQEWLPHVVWISIPGSSGQMRLAAVITRGVDGIYVLDFLDRELLGV